MQYISKNRKNSRRDIIKNASEFLYKQQDPFVPYGHINELIKNVNVELFPEIKIFCPSSMVSILSITLKQIIFASSHLLQQLIIYEYDPKQKLDFFLPKNFLNFLNSKGIRVNYLKSYYNLMKLSFGRLILSLNTFYSLICMSNLTSDNDYKSTCTVVEVPTGLLPIKNSSTFLHWLENSSPFRKKFTRFKIITNDTSGKKIYFSKKVDLSHEVFPGVNMLSKLIFLFYFTSYFLIAFLMLCFGRWQLSFLSTELITLIYYKLIPQTKKSCAYIFFANKLGLRPLWTYLASKEGIQIVNVFYASSYTLFTYGEELSNEQYILPVIQNANWPNYWVQTDDFSQKLQSMLLQKANIETVGVFPFQDYGLNVPSIKGRNLFVFDVDPSSNFSEYTEHGYIIPNYTDEILTAFWKDIFECAKELNIQIIHKRKRLDPIISKAYGSLLNKIKKNSGLYKQINPNISIYNLIKKNINIPAICIPFTSAADIGYGLGGKCAYYNALERIPNPEKHDPLVHTIYGKDQLKKWLVTQMKNI